MKTLILYTSKTGNTKTYAEDIAKQVNADVAPLKGFRLKKMADYDTIVFGGWVEGGTIKGLDKFLAEYPKIEKKNVIVFSVGMSIPTPDGRSLMIEQNLLDMYHVRYYQFRGSFDMKKLHFPYNFLIMNSLKMMANDATATADQKALLGIKDNPIIVYDREKVDKVVSIINQLSLETVLAKEGAK
jgi:menaquinone-dependent protoporphyrinogen IX oxidase